MFADHKENLEQTVYPILAMSRVLCIKLDSTQTVSLGCINEDLKKKRYRWISVFVTDLVVKERTARSFCTEHGHEHDVLIPSVLSDVTAVNPQRRSNGKIAG